MSFWRGELLKVLARLKELQPLDATLTSIAGLTGAADKGLYFTGADTAALFDLTAAGRALLDDADAAAQRTTLGLGTAAVKNTGTSGNAVPLLDGANTFSATLALALSQPSIIINNTDTAQFGRVLFQESGANVGAFQVIGSLFGTVSRRGNLELIATTVGNDFTITTNGSQLRLTIKKAGDVQFGDSANTLPVPVSIYGSLARGAPITKTADFTVAAAENNLINNKAAATCTVTLPAAASFVGREIMIKNIVAFTVVSASSNVVPLAGGAAGTAILSANAGRFCTLVSDGTNWVIMSGVI